MASTPNITLNVKRPRKVNFVGPFLFGGVLLAKGSSVTGLAFGKQRTQLIKLDAQSMPKWAFRPQFFLKQFLCLVEGRFISFRIVDDFPKHALHS